MGYIAGTALDGSFVAIDIAMISMIKEVPTKTILGDKRWEQQDEKWRKQNKATTVVTTRQTPNQLETYLCYPAVVIMYCMNQGLNSQNSDAFVMLDTCQAYDSSELQALVEGDKAEIKERDLRVPACAGA